MGGGPRRPVLPPVKRFFRRDGCIHLERERIRELSRIGNNLNQLARWANTHKGALDAVLVLSRLDELSGTLKALRQELPEEEAAP